MNAAGTPDNRIDYRLLIGVTASLVLILFSLLHPLYRVRNAEHGDQAAYMELAYNLHRGRGLVSRGLSPFMPTPEIEHPESVRAPLYPLFLSIFADDSAGFFLRAKLATLGIGLTVLLVSFLVLGRGEGFVVSAVFVLLLAHNRPFQTHATELWCENMLLLFCVPAFFLIRSTLEEKAGRALFAGLVAGILLGLGYLTKASALLVLLCWAITTGWLLVRRRLPFSSPSVKSAIAGGVGFLGVVFPYLLWNRITTGRFFRDVDLRGAFWLDSGRDYWIPHASPPTALSYFSSHSFFDLVERLVPGMWRQGWNLVETTTAWFHSGEAVGLVILGLGLIGLAAESSTRWRGFQILFSLITLLLAGWYATIDVTPRFIYLLLPLILYNAALGLVFVASRLASGEKAGDRTAREGKRWALAVVAVLLVADVGRVARPLEGSGYRVTPSESETIAAIRRHVNPDEVLCIGPSHRLPYPWLIDRKTVFLPDYADWEAVLDYFERFRVKAFLLDQEIFFRRPRLLGGLVSWTREGGLSIRQEFPGMQPAFRSPGPFGEFFLLVRERK